MLTATKDKVLPTAMVGSFPRPSWFTENLRGRPFKVAMGDSQYREQYTDAVACYVNEQERAGLDILTDGLFASPAYKIYGKLIAEKGYFGAPGFTATTGLKDVLLALAAGEAVAVPLPSANVGRDRLLSAIAHGDGDRDWSVMALEQARSSGLA